MQNFKKRLLTIFLICCLLFLKFSFNDAMKDDNPSDDYLQPDFLNIYQKWSFDTGGTVESTPSAYDLNGDGLLEVVFGSNDDNVYCINSTGGIVWNYTTGGNVVSSPAIVDLNYDYFPEILVGSYDHYLYCLNSTGDFVWSFDTSGAIQSSATIADLNNDGSLNILISSHGWLYCLFHNGSLFWSNEYGAYGRQVLAVADLDDDGSMEVIVPNAGYLVVLDSSGYELYGYPFQEIYANPAIADFDQDGILDIVVSADDDFYGLGLGIVCLELNFDFTELQPKWFYPFSKWTYTSPVVADIDNDGFFEVIIGNDDDFGDLLCLSHLGTVEWPEFPGTSINFHYPSPAIADVNNDSDLNIIFLAQGLLYCYSNSGGFLDAFAVYGNEFTSPIIVDLDLDGISEILIGSYDDLVCLGLSGIASSGSQQWSTDRGSVFRTGQMDGDSDYLDDLTEEFYGTNESNNDTDEDFLEDMVELFTVMSDPLNNDTDNDQLLDGEEVLTYFTSPLNNDTDTDGLTDGIEVLTYNSNPNDNDTDTDGIDDFSEIFVYGTNITNPDSDFDGLLDGEEVNTYSTDPLNRDSDNDGYSDYLEIIAGTDPNDPNDHPPLTITPPPVTITPPPVTITPPPDTITLPPGTITQNNTVTTTVEAGIILVTSVASIVTVLTIVVILIRKKRK